MQRNRQTVLALVLLTGCGRIGIEMLSSDGGELMNVCSPREDDSTCDGVDDDCDGNTDEDFVSASTACGAGACRGAGVRTCSAGVESDTCTPLLQMSTSDLSCNGIDENCSGVSDEDYVPTPTTCGVGACRTSGTLACTGGRTMDTCVPGLAASSDGPVANGVDDDCDGSIDEESCVPTTLTFGPGAYNNIVAPPYCGSATVQLWGGGGGSGNVTSVGDTGTPGRGGSGGYARSLVTLSGALALYVGNGGTGCGAGGVNPGSATYNGGAGGDRGNGDSGQDGNVTGGGAPSVIGVFTGGRGYYGGGGAASGVLAPWPPYPGAGGGGGAASVALIGGTRAVVAGGGGGGGGANGSSVDSTGCPGGEGCSGPGGNGSAGSGGGGGVCLANTFTRGNNGTPASSELLPAGRASGASGSCGNGGGGYAIVTFAP